jgi:hypothetical protein
LAISRSVEPASTAFVTWVTEASSAIRMLLRTWTAAGNPAAPSFHTRNAAGEPDEAREMKTLL